MTNTSHTIADMERDTGLSKDTLRVWERRYGFPTPSRDAQGERRYDDGQLLRLRHIRRLIDAGHRPGAIVALPLEDLLALSADTQGARGGVTGAGASAAPDQPSEGLPEPLRQWMNLLQRHQTRGLRASINQYLLANGLSALVRDGLAPMNTLVGNYWLEGRLAVFEEHLYTEVVLRVLRQAISQAAAGRPVQPPMVLLTTVPGEQHQLGLMMAEAAMVLEGCETLALGVQTPLPEIAQAAMACQANVVALGFSAASAAREARDALEQLRSLLPAHIEIWTGGQCAGLVRRPRTRDAVAGHTHLARLEAIGEAVARWRAGAMLAGAAP
ncbi:MAG: MerR family transcriptional regulator [Gammaproteobacteria bacterium]